MKPDPTLPGTRRLGYALNCFLSRHPLFWRTLGAVWRRFPVLSGLFPFAARHQAVKDLMRRSDSFQSTSHRPNLVAGDFLIGMAPGPDYRHDREHFHRLIPAAQAVQARCDRRARRLVASLAPPGKGPDFDLIEDYLMGLVYHGVISGLGLGLPTIVGGRRGEFPDRASLRQYLLEVRHVAAQLFGGAGAPLDVQMRAHACAASLRQRVDEAGAQLRADPTFGRAPDPASITRNGVGYAWVSHPVTVQATALVFKELLKRGDEYAALHAQAQALGQQVWADAGFRELVQRHVQELMRFRPVFAVVGRDVPRDTHLDAGGGRCPLVKGGSSVAALTISALFDPRWVPDGDAYSVNRSGLDPDERMMMFGYGEHQCPGRWVALEIMTSALIGLLTLPRLRLSRLWWPRRLRYDGPMITEMRLSQVPT